MEQRPLHWSERAKMHAPSRVPGSGGHLPPQKTPRKVRSGRRRRASSRFGRSFRITLSLVLCAAAAAAMIFFWYLPGRDSGADTGSATIAAANDRTADMAARKLVRESMTVIEALHADTGTYDPLIMTPDLLMELEPGITFIAWPDETVFAHATARAAAFCVNYHGTESGYCVGTMSASGNIFGVSVDKRTGHIQRLFKNGVERDWSTLDDPTTGAVPSTAASPAPSAATTQAYDDYVLGCTFHYPASWIRVQPQDMWGPTLGGPSDIIVGNPVSVISGIPMDFIAFCGERKPGETAPSARALVEELSAMPSMPEQASIGVVVTEHEPITEFEVNGISACSWSGRTQGSATPPQIWKIVALVLDDAAFIFYFVSLETNLGTNEAVFEATLGSFQMFPDLQ